MFPFFSTSIACIMLKQIAETGKIVELEDFCRPILHQIQIEEIHFLKLILEVLTFGVVLQFFS